jgi:hypothetical protein
MGINSPTRGDKGVRIITNNSKLERAVLAIEQADTVGITVRAQRSNLGLPWRIVGALNP